jgi:ABC-type glycerol-3-phosphate transport system permease component
MRQRIFNSRFKRIFWLIVWVLILIVYLFPFAWMVMTGFRNPVDTYSWPPKFIFTPTLQGFHYLFEVRNFQSYLSNSLIVSLLSTFFLILLATPAAYASAHLNPREKGFLLSPRRMIPPIALVVPVYLLASRWHLLDTYQVLIAINVAFNLPFAIWLTRSFFREIPRELREAAIIDGCSEMNVFRKIVLPLVAAAAVFTFIAAWNEFLFAVALTTKRAATAPVAALGFRAQFGIQWAALGAASIMISAPVIVFAVAMQKYLLRGMTMGALR